MTSKPMLLREALQLDGGLLQTGPFGSQLKQSEYSEDGVPVIMPKDIHDGRVATDTVARVPEATAERLARHRLALNAVVLPRRGEVTKRAFIGEGQEGWLCGTGCLKIEAKGKAVWPKFLYYHLGTPGSIEWLERNAVGSTMLNLSAEIVARYPLRLPPLAQQKHIARVLAEYDALIENNQKRIALLEEAARLLYREWFVHLRFPGHEHVKVIDGVPEGWERRPLSACATFQSGGTPSKSRGEFWQGDVPWISSGELTSMRISTSTHCVTDEAVRAGSRYAEVGTILGVVRGMSLAKQFRLGVVSRRVCFNQDLKAFVPNRGVESLYLFHAIDEQRDRIRQSAGEASHGTKKLETAVLEAVSIPVATPMLRELFTEIVSPMHRQIDVLTEQIGKLARARDIFLPRLMNGEIAV